MKGLRLYKAEKLCSETAVGALFAARRSEPSPSDVHSALAYPLRALWRSNPGRRGPDVAQFLISVPRRKIRHAVDRVTLRRRTREAYRLNRSLLPEGAKIDIAFIWVAAEAVPSSRIVWAMRRLLERIARSQAAPEAQPADPALTDRTPSPAAATQPC